MKFNADEFGSRFHEKFRGDYGTIQKRLSVYIPYVQKTIIQFNQSGQFDNLFFLDLGCGRGELIDLLQQSGIPSVGIDSNPEMIKECQKRGLNAQCSDLQTYLSSCPDESLAGIFLLQVIEHLTAQAFIELIGLCRDKLIPGGLLVTETINARNIQAAASDFHADLTHHKPIFPDTLDFVYEYWEFFPRETIWLSPYPDYGMMQSIPGEGKATELINYNFNILNQLLFPPHDYAVLGWKNKNTQ